jgi:hypothetical protein
MIRDPIKNLKNNMYNLNRGYTTADSYTLKELV